MTPHEVVIAIRKVVTQNPQLSAADAAKRVLSRIPKENRDDILLWLLTPRINIEVDRMRSKATRDVKQLPKPEKKLAQALKDAPKQEPRARRAFDAFWSSPVRVGGKTKLMRDLTPEDCFTVANQRKAAAKVLTDGSKSWLRLAGALSELGETATLQQLPEEMVRATLAGDRSR